MNPCDFKMASHLRFDAKTGKIIPTDSNGEHTERLLQLNEEASVKYRVYALHIVRSLEREIREDEDLIKKIESSYRKGNIDQVRFDAEITEAKERIDETRCVLLAQTGELPLPPLPRHRNGLVLFS